ncbi:uncharacterized protein LOC131244012 [Magnolia sinica]|uniref:uncharacterized protein LOC131244012 n=1 Tax=Magnolia sinica TaxID=86752 RepID=UPI002658FA13|nr:uncharacterized protein LOC131244012 [Magnolia sinica]
MKGGVNVKKRNLTGRTPTFSSPVLICLVPLALFSLIIVSLIILHIKVEGIVSRTKTVAGHNLDPTPWHPFPPLNLKQSIIDDDDDESRPWWGLFPQVATSPILHCSYLLTCPTIIPSPSFNSSSSSSSPPSCLPLFQWIHQDLYPWSLSRISFSTLMQARKHAAFRVVISSGRLYVDFYYACVQSRSMFTIWGLLQLLRRYPGMIPDVDLMFDCMDKPIIRSDDFSPSTTWPPPPLFRYCTTKDHLDIPFPDWSFWGWPEVNIAPWDEEFRSIKLGSQELNWKKKSRTAYWKGNPDVQSPIRTKLLSCNNSKTWGAQIMRQDWAKEARAGFKQSKLANQCNYRYKIYAEGYAWSVSIKYIIACGSLSLIIHPQYKDFLSRGLMPRKNYWPISPTNLCPSIKFAVDWGNEHPLEAEAIGKGGQDFMQNLNMERVYEYMYHLIVEYSKLQDFKPTPPSSAQEMCEDSILCFADQKQRHFLKRSSASPSSSLPCTLPAPDHHLIERWIQEEEKIIGDQEKLETT